MKLVLSAAALLGAFITGAALADGVPLITAGTGRVPTSPSQKDVPGFVKFHPIVLNKTAFGANVLTVMVDGKLYRFVGTVTPPSPPGAKVLALEAAEAAMAASSPGYVRRKFINDIYGWVGTTGNVNEQLVMVRNAEGVVSGTITLPPSRALRFNSNRATMQEIDRNAVPPPKWVLVEPSAPAASGAKQ